MFRIRLDMFIAVKTPALSDKVGSLGMVCVNRKTDPSLGAKPDNGSFISGREETVRASVLVVNWRARQVCCQNVKDMCCASAATEESILSLHAIHYIYYSKLANDTVLIKAIMGLRVESCLLNTPVRHLDNLFFLDQSWENQYFPDKQYHW